MIEGKPILVTMWLCLMLAACALPFLLLLRRRPAGLPARLAVVCFVLATMGMAVALMMRLGWPHRSSPLAVALVLVVPLLFGARVMGVLGGLAVLPLFATVAWWGLDAPARNVVFLYTGVVGAFLPLIWRRPRGAPVWLTLAGTLLAGVAAGLSTGIDETPAFVTLWNHWSAYVGPVDAMLSGGVPFRDFPVQYGLGPTLLIAALGPGDPWRGLYIAIAGSNLLHMLAMAGCVMLLLRRAPRGLALLAVAAMLCALLLWSDPPDELTPLTFPSVAGLRFAPLSLLLLAILSHEETGRPRLAAGYVIWLVSLAWSPEAGGWASITWFAWLGLRHAQAAQVSNITGVLRAVLRGGAVAALSVALGGTMLVLAFRAGFGDWPDWTGFMAYIRNPPGSIPSNPWGPVWLLVAGLAIGAIALARADAAGARRNFACLLGLLSVGSYYLGRSHDNNVLNLFPFLVLLLAAALSGPLPAFCVGYARTAMAAVLLWPICFGFSTWVYTWRAHQALVVGATRLLKRFRFASPAEWQAYDLLYPGKAADAGAALAWLAMRPEGTAVLVNAAYTMPRQKPGAAWTGVNNIANYVYLPPEVVQSYIHAGAMAYHRAGWLLIERGGVPATWLQSFSMSYRVAEQHDFGGYTAYLLLPK